MEATWKDVALETIYMFLNPTVDPIGLAGYLEVKGGDDHTQCPIDKKRR